MRRGFLAIAILLATPAARADSANLRLSIYKDFVLSAGESVNLQESLYNAGPDTARNVVLTTEVTGFPGQTSPCSEGCKLGDIPAGRLVTVPHFSPRAPVSDFTFAYKLTVTSDTPDPNPADNSAAVSVRVSTAPLLVAAFHSPPFADPGLPFQLSIYVFNGGYSEAHDAVATVDLPEGTGVRSLPQGCSSTLTSIQCEIPLVKKLADVDYGNYTFSFTLVAPPLYDGGKITFTASARAREADFYDQPVTQKATVTLFRSFLVTTTADSGSGSLRAAISAANALCPQVTCAIQFNIAEPSQHRWKTIRLRSPLPKLLSSGLRIDGATQAGFSGDANPDGPPVEIQGGGEVDGDGLWLSPGAEIANLAINGFRGNGITLFMTRTANIHHNYIGTDPSGSIAIPNERGIGVYQQDPFTDLATLSIRITSNVISGNLRSAIFAWGGTYAISGNRLGLKAHADEALPNGASGIYFHHSVGRVEANANIIAFNREMGIAVAPATRFILLDRNWIWGNGGQAIDDGLDGPSSSVMTEHGPLETPVIISAVYDPSTNTTSIRGRRVPDSFSAQFYVSDAPGPFGAGDAQRFLAPSGYDLKTGDYFLRLNQDLRGQWVSLLIIALQPGSPFPDSFFLYRTSELSRAVQVQ